MATKSTPTPPTSKTESSEETTSRGNKDAKEQAAETKTEEPTVATEPCGIYSPSPEGSKVTPDLDHTTPFVKNYDDKTTDEDRSESGLEEVPARIPVTVTMKPESEPSTNDLSPATVYRVFLRDDLVSLVTDSPENQRKLLDQLETPLIGEAFEVFENYLYPVPAEEPELEAAPCDDTPKDPNPVEAFRELMYRLPMAAVLLLVNAWNRYRTSTGASKTEEMPYGNALYHARQEGSMVTLTIEYGWNSDSYAYSETRKLDDEIVRLSQLRSNYESMATMERANVVRDPDDEEEDDYGDHSDLRGHLANIGDAKTQIDDLVAQKAKIEGHAAESRRTEVQVIDLTQVEWPS